MNTNQLSSGLIAALAVIGGLIYLYRRKRILDSERSALLDAPAPPPPKPYVAPPGPATPEAATAVLLVSGYSQAGVAMLEELARIFAGHYTNLIFLSLVPAGADLPADARGLDEFRNRHEDCLESYVPLARARGLQAEYRCAIGLLELGPACREILGRHPRACFVLSRTPVPGRESMISTLPEDLSAQIRSHWVQQRIPFIEMAVSLEA